MFRSTFLAGWVALAMPWSLAPVQAPANAAPAVSITLGARHSQVTPARCGFTHTGGGTINVTQPTPDIVIVTMSGVAVAGGHPCLNSTARMVFDLTQCLEISFDDPKLKKAKLSIEGRVIGLLRSECKGDGSAVEGPGCATVAADTTEILTLGVPAQSVTGGENLSINDHEGPVEVPIIPGKFTLHQTFVIAAQHGHSLRLTKAASAEFAPDPALDPLWISYWEPFHGTAKKDFGFQVTIKVAPEVDAPPAAPKR